MRKKKWCFRTEKYTGWRDTFRTGKRKDGAYCFQGWCIEAPSTVHIGLKYGAWLLWAPCPEGAENRFMRIRQIARPGVKVCKFEKRKTINSLRLSGRIPVVLIAVFEQVRSIREKKTRSTRGESLRICRRAFGLSFWYTTLFGSIARSREARVKKSREEYK